MTTVRKFSPAGPCIPQGELTAETTKFYVFRDRFNPARERKLSKGTAHIEPCKSCRDHPQTYYPNGYQD
jgi:hypothetical protein